MTSAQSISSALSGVSASLLVPAEAASISGRCENTCSAVGLRSLFRLQTKSPFFNVYLPPVPLMVSTTTT